MYLGTAQCEAIIEKGFKTFTKVGNGFAERSMIRDFTARRTKPSKMAQGLMEGSAALTGK